MTNRTTWDRSLAPSKGKNIKLYSWDPPTTPISPVLSIDKIRKLYPPLQANIDVENSPFVDHFPGDSLVFMVHICCYPRNFGFILSGRENEASKFQWLKTILGGSQHFVTAWPVGFSPSCKSDSPIRGLTRDINELRSVGFTSGECRPGSINHQFMIGFVTLSLSLPPSPSVKTAGGSCENGGYFITPLYILRYTTI